MTVTDTIKNSLKYPLIDKTKILILGVFYTIISLLGFYGSYTIAQAIYNFDFENLAMSTNVTDLTTASNLISTQIPPNTMAIVVIIAIITLILTIYLNGYDLRVIRKAINKEENLPGFENPLGMFIEGIKLTIVSIAYAIIPIILISAGTVLNNTIGQLLLAIGVILGIYLVLVYIMAVNYMVLNDNKLSYAFKLTEINNLISEVTWLRYIGGLFIVLLILLIVSFTAQIVLGILLSGFIILTKQFLIATLIESIIMSLCVQSFLSIFASHFCGSLYNERLEELEDIDEEYII